MGGKHFEKLDDEGKALTDSWDNVVRIMLLVTFLTMIVWACVSALRWAVHEAAHVVLHAADSGGWKGLLFLLGALGVGGAIAGALSRRPGWKEAAGDGMELTLENYHITYEEDGDDPRPRYERPAFALAFRKAVLTFISLGSGASGGLEAPGVLVAEGLSSGFARVMRIRSEYELRTYQLAGIAAAVATLLGAPFSAAIFATEVVYGDRIIYRKLAYALWAGVIAYALNNRFRGFVPLFASPAHSPEYSLGEYFAVTVVALTVSVPLAVGFAQVVKQLRKVSQRLGGYAPVLLSLCAGLIAIALKYGLGVAPSHVLGMGEATIAGLLHGSNELGVWWVVAIIVLGKIVTTALAVSARHSVGMLIPSMFLGGASGALVAQVVNLLGWRTLDPALFVVVGISSSLVAVVGVPLAAVALVLEVFGKAFGPPAILASGVTYLVTLRLRLYAAQRVSPNPLADETG
ncbi:MAG TPA: chloride channel protein [Polyangiaceae bacterium]|nr:chloride channel protein [Polyangiaceae bacterium]